MNSECKPAPRIIVVFRNDDPSALSDLEHERRIFALFEKYGVPQTLGVIPNVSVTALDERRCGGEKSLLENPAMIGFLKDYVVRTGSEIAVHGYTHRTNRRSNPARRDFSEYQQLPLAEQETMIRHGSAILEEAFGARPVTFVPPWNRLDHNTVLACQRAGFEAISARAYTAAPDRMVSCGTNCDPVEFAAMWEAAKRSSREVFITILFHSNTTQKPEDIQRLAQILETVSSDPECRCMTVAEVIRKCPDRLRTWNEAGRNAVSFHEVEGSVRAKVWFYLQLIPALRRVSGLDRLVDFARHLYVQGAYEECGAAGERIDAKCRGILMGTRTAFLLLGIVGGVLLAMLLSAGLTLSGLAIWILPILMVAAGFVLSLRASAVETRRETVMAACLTAAGYAVSLWGNAAITC